MLKKNSFVTFTLEKLIARSKLKFGNDYLIKGREMINGTSVLEVMHLKCGRIKKVKADSYFYNPTSGHCQFCNGGRPKLKLEKIKKLFYSLNDKELWELLEEVDPYIYPSNGLKQRQFKVLHKVCGTITLKQSNRLYSKPVGCLNCRLNKLH